MNDNSSQLSSLLTDTIRMLCCNGVEYSDNLRIQGLLVVTADTNRVHVIEISETFPGTQTPGVGSSGLCEMEPEMNDDYKPQMAAQDIPVHAPVAYQEPDPFHSKSPVRRGFHAVKPAKPRGGSFRGVGNRSVGRPPLKKPKVKMEDPVILVDSPENNAADGVETKVEADWATAEDGFQHLPEMASTDFHGGGMQFYGHPQSSNAGGLRRRGKHSSPAAHTVTSSDGLNEQSAGAFDDAMADEKPYHLNYHGDQIDEEGGQAFFPTDSETGHAPSFDFGPESSATDMQPTHFCQYRDCGLAFLHKRSLDRHQRRKHGALFGVARQVAFFCAVEDCQRTFYAKSTFMTHQRLVHGIITDELQ